MRKKRDRDSLYEKGQVSLLLKHGKKYTMLLYTFYFMGLALGVAMILSGVFIFIPILFMIVPTCLLITVYVQGKGYEYMSPAGIFHLRLQARRKSFYRIFESGTVSERSAEIDSAWFDTSTEFAGKVRGTDNFFKRTESKEETSKENDVGSGDNTVRKAFQGRKNRRR